MSVLFLPVFDRDLKTNWLLQERTVLNAMPTSQERKKLFGGKWYKINRFLLRIPLSFVSGGFHEYIDTMEEKYCNMSLSTQGMIYFLILMCPQDLDILRMNSKVQLMAFKAVVIVCLTHILLSPAFSKKSGGT